MATETLSKEAQAAVEFFERKLAFEIGPVGVKYALEQKEPIQIVDLRTAELYEKSHLPGAINLSIEELEKSQEKLDKNKTVVVYCYNHTCHLSAKAALVLAKKGFNVKELVGGFDTYAKADMKLEGKAAQGSCSSHSTCG